MIFSTHEKHIIKCADDIINYCIEHPHCYSNKCIFFSEENGRCIFADVNHPLEWGECGLLSNLIEEVENEDSD